MEKPEVLEGKSRKVEWRGKDDLKGTHAHTK